MNYKYQYYKIIDYRKNNPLPDDAYGENHHIKPKSEGGTNDKDNLVLLTAREHYICHLLLAKIYDDYKMWYAWNMMFCKSPSHNDNRYFKFNSRLYERFKILFREKNSEYQKKRFADPKNKEYLKKPKSELHKQHLIESFKNRDFTGEKNPMYQKNIKDFMTTEAYNRWKYNVGNSRRGKVGVFKCSESTKKKISAANKGRKHTDQSRANMSKSRKIFYYKKLIKKFGFEQAKIEVCKLNTNRFTKWYQWVHKGYDNVRVSKFGLCDYLAKGWTKGFISRNAIISMRKTRIGQVMSEETRLKISNSKKGKINLKLRGRHLSDEHKNKISIARKSMKGKYNLSK